VIQMELIDWVGFTSRLRLADVVFNILILKSGSIYFSQLI